MGSVPTVYPASMTRGSQRKREYVVGCPFQPSRIDVPDRSFTSMYIDGLKDYSAPALIDAATGAEFSRPMLLRKGEIMAGNLLLKKICAPRDVMAIYAPNSVNWVVALTAAFRLDLIAAGISAALKPVELKHHLKLCRPRVLYTTEALLSSAREALEDLNLDTEVIVDGNCDDASISLTSLLIESGGVAVLPEVQSLRSSPDDVCLMLFSSGTTGLQKAISITHENLIAQSIVATHKKTAFVFPKSITFCPFANVGGLWIVLFTIIKGYTSYFMGKFDLPLFLLTLQTVKDVWLIPPVAYMLVKSELVDKYNLSLRSICCGAAPLSRDVEGKLKEKFPGVIFRQLYGMTESGISTGMTESCSNLCKPGTVGVPWFNTQIKVVNTETGEPLPHGKVGEILIKSPIVMLRYEGNPEATAEAVDKDGWNHTGDLGYYDEDGYFYIVDRVKELIKYNGHQVPPAELEAVLFSHPAVADAAVVGIPDASAGELPTGIVVLQPSAKISEKDLIDYVNGRVAPYKKLRGGIKFVTHIPKTPTGKILRKEIKKGLLKSNL